VRTKVVERRMAEQNLCFGLRPLSSATIEIGDGGAVVVKGFGSDPQLLWRPANPLTLFDIASIEIEVALQVLDGVVTAPRVYANWGDGFVESSAAALRSTGRGSYSAVLSAAGRVCLGIRFDPSIRPCSFVLTEFRVIPDGRPVASYGLRDRLLRLATLTLGPWLEPQIRFRRKVRLWARGLLRKSARFTRGNVWRQIYQAQLSISRGLRSPEFAASPGDALILREDAPRVIAFYLPQYHAIPENDKWWGRGFTEWTSVTRAVPEFVDHYQPRLPSDLGFYDLRLTNNITRQMELAAKGGVSGFCFYYYWFGGKRLLEGPLEHILQNKDLKLPFMLCWANENWTRRWDGSEADVLIAQDHSPEDDREFFKDVARYMSDPRYIRVEGRPVLVIYRPDILPDPGATAERWRSLARQLGLGEIYLLCCSAFGFWDYASIGYDGVIQFPPHGISGSEITSKVALANPAFAGKVFDYAAVVKDACRDLASIRDPALYPGCMPGWDNSGRRPGRGHVFHRSTPSLFRDWLRHALAHSARVAKPGSRLVFVNAWNEWGEGAYLEPDRWFGHAYLQALRTALSDFSKQLNPDDPRCGGLLERSGPAVVLLHLYYSDLIDWFAERLNRDAPELDQIITFPVTWSSAELDAMRAAFPRAQLVPTPNRGRDVAPFIAALHAAKLAGHELFVKLHSKRSPHRSLGDQWRNELYDGLLGQAVDRTLDRFRRNPRLGMLACSKSRMFLSDPDVMDNNIESVLDAAKVLKLSPSASTPFVAGTMFWGKVDAFAKLVENRRDLKFEEEMGKVDGTLAHALERLMCEICSTAGFQVEFLDETQS